MLSIKVFDHAAGRVVCDKSISSLPVRIGRDSGNDVCLDFEFVSSWHVELRSDPEGGLMLCDLGSRNSLKIGGQKLKSGTSLALSLPNSATLGPLEFHFDETVVGTAARGESADAPNFDFLKGSASPAAQGGEIADADLPPTFGGADGSEIASRILKIQAGIRRLRPLHAQLEISRRQWEDSLNKEVRALREQVADESEETRDHDMAMLLRSFPAADRGGFALALGGDILGDVSELAAVVQAAGELLPGMRTPTNEDETRRFLARVVDVLRVFAAATLEVQHVRRRQAAELDVRWEEPPDPLIALETADEVLRYLLDWRDSGESRSEELVRSLAAVVDHVQGYVKASLVATRKVLASLSPMEIERGAVDRWPSRASALWRHYQSSWSALVGDGHEHDHLSPAFRGVLAEAYRDTLARAGVPTHSEDKRSKRGWS